MKSRASKSKKSKRPPMLRVPEEMKEWGGLLEAELASWPEVSARPMFGMRAFYRKRRIFAAVPRTRALNSPTSVIFKLHAQRSGKKANNWDRQRQFHDMEDSRLKELRMTSAGWLSFELNSAEDIRDALYWFEQAYNKAQAGSQAKGKSS
jgi:hypothetical protein